jgi:HKD family nuclease
VPLKPGLYDQPVTERVATDLRTIADELVHAAALDSSRSAEVLGRVLHERLVHVLGAIKGADTAERVERQLALINELLDRIGAEAKGVVMPEDKLAEPARLLRAILAPTEPPNQPRLPPSPGLPLAESGLLVNGHRDLSVGPEIKKEIQSADRVDLLCSFLEWSGFRLVETELRELCRRGTLRVLTTAYMSATERRALDELQAMGAEVKVSYDTERTRLHAKAWLFHRESGFSTAMIGSSNLSHAAMLDGVEWNVRVSQTGSGAILEKFAATFEQYWADPSFRPYDAGQFTEAVKRGKHQRLAPFLKLDVEPRPHQREILDALDSERRRGHHKNLVLAATGTGKTIVAALDFQRLKKTHPRLLFVPLRGAHPPADPRQQPGPRSGVPPRYR